MVNYNGSLLERESCNLSLGNRGFHYGDSLFETLRVKGGRICFLEDHYFRLMASMRMLRMQIPMDFTLEYFELQLRSLLDALSEQEITKLKCSVFRKDGGLYTPTSNEVEFLIQGFSSHHSTKENYVVDLYKDHFVSSGFLSTLKSSNRLLNVLSSIFAKENDLDNCVLLNEQKNIVEFSNANLFLVQGNHIRTPQLSDGCIKGISRKKVIEILEGHAEYTLEETSISSFDLQKADELFLTNAIIGVQSVTHYRKKKYATGVGAALSKAFDLLEG